MPDCIKNAHGTYKAKRGDCNLVNVKMKKKRIKAEAFDCLQYFYGMVQEPRIRCLLQFKSHLDIATLKKAVDLSLPAVPQISCIFDERRHNWEKQGFTAEDIVHCIKLDPKNDREKWLLASLDPTCEPQLKLFLIREKDKDTLCCIINHMVCDGAGFKEYLYLLSDLYSKCKKNAEYATQSEPPGKRNLNQILKNLSLKEKITLVFAKSEGDKLDPSLLVPIQGNPKNPMLVLSCIEQEPFERVCSFAKSNGVTVNDLLLTAYVRILKKITGRQKIIIPCPVDLRKYRKANQQCGICNLTGNYLCSVDIQPGETFADTLGKISAQIRHQKEENACLRGPMLYHMLFHLVPFFLTQSLFHRLSPVPITSYTNLGILDEHKLRFLDLPIEEAFLSTTVKRTPCFQLSVSTYAGCCTLSCSLYGTTRDKEFVSAFLHQVKTELLGSLTCGENHGRNLLIDSFLGKI